MFDTKSVTIDWAGRPLTLETGRVARQADGSVFANKRSTLESNEDGSWTVTYTDTEASATFGESSAACARVSGALLALFVAAVAPLF
jgi:hypothetical protein